MDKQPLTVLQARILEFVRDEIRSSGRSPTMREIQAAFGYQSPHTAQFHVNKLIKGGHLRRGEGHRAHSHDFAYSVAFPRPARRLPSHLC